MVGTLAEVTGEITAPSTTTMLLVAGSVVSILFDLSGRRKSHDVSCPGRVNEILLKTCQCVVSVVWQTVIDHLFFISAMQGGRGHKCQIWADAGAVRL